MMRAGHAVLIKIRIFYHKLIGCHLQFLELMSLCYGEARMQIETCRNDCCDLSNLQAANEQLS